MRFVTVVAVFAVALTGLAHAQNPEMRRRALQEQVMLRLLENYRNQAGLSDEQFQHVREVASRSNEARREIQEREREAWRALEGQLRPGIAADADSVNALMDQILDLQVELIEQVRRDQQEYSEFLTAVQRAQLMISVRRLQNNIQGIMQRRGRVGQPGPMR